MVAIGCLAAIGAAACGQEEQPGLGADVAGPTTVATTTTTIPTTTSTTIDFNRPITQGSARLADEAGLAEVAALVADMRGQTANVSAQVARLAPFIDLTSAPVAQIIGVDVILAPKGDDGGHRATATVRFRVPDAGPEMVKAIGDEFYGLAWNANGESTRDVEGGTRTETAFRYPGADPDELEFRSSVETGVGPTTVELTYSVNAEDDEVEDEDGVTYFERLSAWPSDLSLPRAASLSEVGVRTEGDTGTIFARYALSAEDEAEAVAELVAAIASGDYELIGSSADDPPASGPLRLAGAAGTIVVLDISPAPGEETFLIEATSGFDLAPLD